MAVAATVAATTTTRVTTTSLVVVVNRLSSLRVLKPMVRLMTQATTLPQLQRRPRTRSLAISPAEVATEVVVAVVATSPEVTMIITTVEASRVVRIRRAAVAEVVIATNTSSKIQLREIIMRKRRKKLLRQWRTRTTRIR